MVSMSPGSGPAGSSIPPPATPWLASGKPHPAPGNPRARLDLPRGRGEKEDPKWPSLHILDDALAGGYNPPPAPERPRGKVPPALSSSRFLAVLDRHSGRLRWQAA